MEYIPSAPDDRVRSSQLSLQKPLVLVIAYAFAFREIRTGKYQWFHLFGTIHMSFHLLMESFPDLNQHHAVLLQF